MKNSKIQLRGYIFAREIENNIISHKVQNLVIRDFCKNNDFSCLLSSVEYKMKNSFLILEDIIKEIPKINGIVMLSMFQLPLKDEERKKIYKKIFNKKKYLCFAVENIIISNYREMYDFDIVFKLNNILKNYHKEKSNKF